MIFVTVKIKPEFTDEFPKTMAVDAAGSRSRPAVIASICYATRRRPTPSTFMYYEVYQDDGPAIDFHKSTPHYKAWADFKANNPTAVVSQTVVKAGGVDL